MGAAGVAAFSADGGFDVSVSTGLFGVADLLNRLRANLDFQLLLAAHQVFRHRRTWSGSRPSHLRVRFFQVNRGLTRLFQQIIGRLCSPLQRARPFLNNQEFVDQRPNERLRSDDFVPVRLGQLGARIADFSFKSATKLGSQMGL